MTEERFRALAEAYGGDIRRWPAAERAAAQTWLAQAGEAAEGLLREAADLDHLLWSSPTLTARADFTRAIVDLAPAMRAGRRLWAWLTGAGVGVALAGATAAGFLVAGLFAPEIAAVTAPHPAAHAGIPDEAIAALGEGSDAG